MDTTIDYSDWDAYDLLEALEMSGEQPPPELLDAILAKGKAVVSGLLEMLEDGVDDAWAAEDPRRFRDIHAGLLLVEMAEPRALPVLERLYRDEERQGDLNFWLDPRLPRYGEAGLALLEGLFNDPDLPHTVRVSTITGLTHMARQPALRDRVVPLLRSVLPPVDDDGTTPDFSDLPDEIDYEYVEPWTWAAEGLMHARDLESRERILALYDEEVIDDWILDPDDFVDALEEPPPGPEMPSLPEYYRQKHEEEEAMREQVSSLQKQAELVSLMGQIQEQTGLSDAAMGELLAQMDELADEEGEVDEAKVQQVVLQILAEQGGGRLVPPPSESEQALHKIGRNERVTIRDPETGETATLKYKHAQKKLDQGWEFVERAG